MRVVFADTLYWVAITNPRDALHRSAKKAVEHLGEHRIVTSELVLVEVLNMLSGHGTELRRGAFELVQTIVDDASVDLVPQTMQFFRDALALIATVATSDGALPTAPRSSSWNGEK